MIVSGGTCSSELAPLLPLLAEDTHSRKPYASGVLTPYPSSQPVPAAKVLPCQVYVLAPFCLTKQTTSCMPVRSNSMAFVAVVPKCVSHLVLILIWFACHRYRMCGRRSTGTAASPAF